MPPSTSQANKSVLRKAEVNCRGLRTRWCERWRIHINSGMNNFDLILSFKGKGSRAFLESDLDTTTREGLYKTRAVRATGHRDRSVLIKC